MPFDWKDFLSLAEELAANEDEASKRTAISRAYYCIFNLAYARAELNVGQRPNGERSSHQWCWRQYRRTSDQTCVKLGNGGDRLKRMRVEADYNPTVSRRLDDMVKKTLLEAQELLAYLAALDPKYPRP